MSTNLLRVRNIGLATLACLTSSLPALAATTDPNFSVVKTSNVSVAVNGQSVTYTITVANTGKLSGTTAFADTSFSGQTLSNWQCTATTGTATCPSGLPTTGGYSAPLTIPGGSSVTFTVTGVVTAASGGTVTNTATSTYAGTTTSSALTLPVITPSTGGTGYAGSGNTVCSQQGGTLGTTNLITAEANGTFGTVATQSLTTGKPYRDLTVTRDAVYTFAGTSNGGGDPSQSYAFFPYSGFTGYLQPESTYVITGYVGSATYNNGNPTTAKNFLNVYGPWQGSFDHTVGSGNANAFLAVNGATTPSTIFNQSAAVTPNTVYEIGFWARSPHGSTSQFGGAGSGAIVAIGAFPNSSASARVYASTPELVKGTGWTRGAGLVNSGQATSMNLKIGNVQVNVQGNDFYLDDIYMFPCLLPFGTISGKVFLDRNDNSALDSTEAGIAGVTVTAVDRNGTTFTTTTASDGSYTFSNLPGALGTYTVSVNPTASPLSSLTATTSTTTNNVAVNTAAGSNGATVSGGNFGFKVVSDLAVSKVGPATATPDQTVTYTIRAWNNGPDAASSVTVADAVPSTLSNVTWTCSAVGSAACTSASGSGNSVSVGAVLSVDTGSVTTADTNYVTVTVTGKAPSAATLESTSAARTFTNVASVSNPNTDPNAANNISSAVVTNMTYSKLTKTVANITRSGAAGSSASGYPNDILEYCIAFNNYGNTALANFIVTDSVPANSVSVPDGYNAAVTNPGASAYGVKLTRSASTSYFTSVAGDDVASLTATGGTFNSGLMTINLGTLPINDSGVTCFRVRIR